MEFFLSSLSGVLAFLGASLSFLAAFFIMRSRRADPDSASLRAQDILSRAKQDADEIIREAESRAEEIMNGAQSLRDRAGERLERAMEGFLERESKRLAAAGEKLFGEYEGIAEETRGAYARVIEEVSKSVSEEARRGILELEEFIKSEMVRYERLTDRGLEEWRRTIEAEIEKKKEAGLKRVEESIYRILFFVSKEVLGRAINLEEHQALVVRALDDAKRQGFFDI